MVLTDLQGDLSNLSPNPSISIVVIETMTNRMRTDRLLSMFVVLGSLSQVLNNAEDFPHIVF